jgi:hypothetical protein
MNSLPVELKSLIASFLFAEVESYNQHVPCKAIELAMSDRDQVIKLRSLCNGGLNFLGKRFKISHTLDRMACMEARQNLTFSILKFKHCHNKWFALPKLKSDHRCMEAFMMRNFEYFSIETMKAHTATLDRLDGKIVALRRKQAGLLRLSKRAPH